MLNAGLALYFSDSIERALGVSMPPEDKKNVRENLPRLEIIEREAKKGE